jgi:anti-sigma-K factor RskA
VNTQEYISSGIVESYVLGLASYEEQLEFEQLCQAHPEVLQAREAFELSLEQYAIANGVLPPVQLKQKVWAEMQFPSSQVINMKSESRRSQSIIPVRKMNLAKYAAAASIVLLLGSTALNFYFYRQYQSSVARLDELVKSQEQLVNNNTIMQTKLQQYESSLAMMGNPKMAIISMKGQAIDPSSLSTIYWDTQTKDVYLLINNLPQPVSDKQYQLWAIVDGKPVDAGIFDMKDAAGLVKMKNIPHAQAFAITLEKKGGSASPDLNAMYVMGKV